MKSWPTKYNGVQFRSRLEARWAALFDRLKWRWHYEPSDDEGWVPDFLLVGRLNNVAVEVKPYEWPDDDRKHIDWLRHAPELAKVRSSARERKLVVGAYPFLNSSGWISVGWVFDDSILSTASIVDTRGKAEMYVPSTEDKYCLDIVVSYAELQSGRDRVNRGVAQAWREAGNKVQWRGDGLE